MTICLFVPKDIPAAATLYCACFAEPPWFELFGQTDIALEMAEILSWPDAIGAVAYEGGSFIGGAYGFSLSRKQDIGDLARLSKQAFYVSEIFVAPPWRVRGVARDMAENVLARAKKDGFVKGVVRTSVDQPAIRRLFNGFGWHVVAEQTVVSRKMVQGVPVNAPDRRIIMTGCL